MRFSINKASANSSKNSLFKYLQTSYYLLLFIAFFYETTITYVVWIMNKVSLLSMITPIVVPLVIILIIILYCASKNSIARIRVVDFGFILIVILALMNSIAFHPNTYDVVMERYFAKVFTTCIPFFLLGLIINVNEDTMNFLCKSSKFALIIGFAYCYYMINFGNPDAIVDDNMGLAYNYLLVEMFVIISAFRSKKAFDIILAILGGLLLFLLGTRGPVVLVVCFLALCIGQTVINDKKRRIPVVLSLVLAVTLITQYYENIILWMIDTSSQIGLSSRIFYKLLDANLLVSAERNDIREILWQKIVEKPFWGYGIAGEWQFVNWNAHNMYLTLLCNYGVIFGGGTIIALVVIFLRAIWKNRNINAQYLLLMFGCLVFAKGIFSGDPISREVFFLIGLSMGQIREIRKRNHNEL